MAISLRVFMRSVVQQYDAVIAGSYAAAKFLQSISGLALAAAPLPAVAVPPLLVPWFVTLLKLP